MRLSVFMLMVLAKTAFAASALPASDFLSSTGVDVHVQHGMPAPKLAALLQYLGIRNVRDGADGNFDVSGLLRLHRQTGVLVAFGPGSGAKEASLARTLAAGRELAAAGALLALEGPNEPGNFGGVTYQGLNSSRLGSWVPVANYQKDFYRAVKSDPVLKSYPVFGPSECGAEDDNAGLQFLAIPRGAAALLPEGTLFADFANVHNYVSGHLRDLTDNQAFHAAAFYNVSGIDGLFGNHGRTWRKHFQGYPESALGELPKVTTETGWKADGTPEGEDVQGKVLLNVFLDQYKAGWKHTFIYELVDDADGAFGLFKGDYRTPRKAAVFIHRLTAILADARGRREPGKIGYSIPNQPETVHDLLLEKGDGTFDLVVWDERARGADAVTVDLGAPYATVKIYDPTLDAAPIKTLASVRAVPLSLSDHAVILELK